MIRNWIPVCLLAVFVITGCKKWESHIALPQQQLSETIWEHIQKDPQLTTFAGYIQKTGLDSLLGASKNITVFAPTNDALAAIAGSISNDREQLRAFLQNHISTNAYFTRDAVDSFRVPLLNGKRAFFINNKFDEATITEGDIYLSNGALHKIDKAIGTRLSIWEYIGASKGEYLQNAYIASLNYQAQDPKLAKVDSINPVTGEPVYVPGTGIVSINTFRTKVMDVANEDSLFTYILLANNAFTVESNRLLPYCNSKSPDTAIANASWMVVKDFAIKGLYGENNLPSILQSKFGVNVQINRSSILSVKKLSNGIVYIVNGANTLIREKIPNVYIEGENPYSISKNSAGTVFYRKRLNPLTGAAFNDIYLNLGSTGANRYATYYTNQLFTTKYKVYLMSLNDKVVSGLGDATYGTDSSLNHIVRIYKAADRDNLLFDESADVTPLTYTEFFLGEFTNGSYEWLLSYPPSNPNGASFILNPATCYIRLQAPAAAIGRPYNITMNYLRFEPVF